MGACVSRRKTDILESLESLPAYEFSSLEKSSASTSSVIMKSIPVSTCSTPRISYSSPRISQMVQYFLTDKVIQGNSANGFFSSVSGITSCTGVTSCTSTFRNLGVTKITSQLYLGSWDDAMNENELRAKRVTHIISAIGKIHRIDGMKQKQYPMTDYGSTDVKKVMKKLWKHVEESQQDGNVLFVHCLSGQNRSATLALAILMKHYRLTLYAAFKKVKNKRPIVHINERYGKQLMSIEKELFGKSTLPENWMQIDVLDMETGKISFVGDNVSCHSTPSVASRVRGISTNHYFRTSGGKPVLRDKSSVETLKLSTKSKRTNNYSKGRITPTLL